MAMLKETRDRWVSALRSGEYQQGRGMLCDQGKYCCLGVLNEVMGNESRPDYLPGKRRYFDQKGEAGDFYSYSMNINWLEGQGVSIDVGRELAKMNDYGVPFVKIAEWIELNVEVED